MATRKMLNVLVTGASSGIGRAVAVELARRGHTVFAAARREAVLADLAATTVNVRPVTLDVTSPESVARAWSAVEAATGGRGVDVVVNAAGYAHTGPVETVTDDAVQGQFATNVFGLLSVTRAALPSMRARRSGRIVNISSVVGRTTIPAMGVYGATKYAVEALSDALRMELAGHGVSVVLVEPGFVRTDLVEGSARERSRYTAAGDDDGYALLTERSSDYLRREMARAASAERVARSIAEVVEMRRPRARYVVPARARRLVALLTALPDGLADRAKWRAVAGAPGS